MRTFARAANQMSTDEIRWRFCGTLLKQFSMRRNAPIQSESRGIIQKDRECALVERLDRPVRLVIVMPLTSRKTRWLDQLPYWALLGNLPDPITHRQKVSLGRMDEHPDATMKTALRVLAAISAGGTPDPNDVEELQQLAPPLADKPIEELAWGVIHVLNYIRRSPAVSVENVAGTMRKTSR